MGYPNGFMVHIFNTCHALVTLPTHTLLTHRLAIKLHFLPFVDKTEPKNHSNTKRKLKKKQNQETYQKRVVSSNKLITYQKQESKTLKKIYKEDWNIIEKE